MYKVPHVNFRHVGTVFFFALDGLKVECARDVQICD